MVSAGVRPLSCPIPGRREGAAARLPDSWPGCNSGQTKRKLSSTLLYIPLMPTYATPRPRYVLSTHKGKPGQRTPSTTRATQFSSREAKIAGRHRRPDGRGSAQCEHAQAVQFFGPATTPSSSASGVCAAISPTRVSHQRASFSGARECAHVSSLDGTLCVCSVCLGVSESGVGRSRPAPAAPGLGWCVEIRYLRPQTT